MRAGNLKLALSTSLALALSAHALWSAPAARPNVLMIAVDDLNDFVDCYGGPVRAKTPNIDRLAKQGVRFNTANCAAPICNPSRVALMTGYNPTSSGIYLIPQYQRDSELLKNAATLPEYFRSNGYNAWGCGKIYHHFNRDNLWTEPQTWDDYSPVLGGAFRKGKPSHGFDDKELISMFDWGPNNTGNGSIEETTDYRDAQWVAGKLEKPTGQPFFLAYGTLKPHLPMWCPQSFFDQYPLESVPLPPYLKTDLDDVPLIGRTWALNGSFTDPKQSKIRNFHQELVAKNKWQEAVQAYLANITFADACIGRVLDALDKSPAASNTIVVLWGDHGWHLGEKDHWQKCTLWERAARVPLIIYAPSVTPSGGGVCDRPVSLVDLYPTLVELCGLPAKQGLDGRSIVPLLRNPSAQWDYPAITTYHRGNNAVRSQQWRFIHYEDGKEELYDMQNDTNEWHNLANDPKYASVLAEHRKWLPKDQAKSVKPSDIAAKRFVYDWKKEHGKRPAPSEESSKALCPSYQ